MEQGNNNASGRPAAAPAMKRLSGKNFILAISLLVLLAVFGFRTYSLSRAPDLDPGLPDYRRSSGEAWGLRLRVRTAAADVEISAERARPGVPDLAAIGARDAGYVFLSGASARSLDPGPGAWTVRGRSARLSADRIEFDDAPVWERADGARKYRRVWIDLHSGQVRGR